MTEPCNVLPQRSVVNTKSYRAAVSRIIRQIQLEHDESDLDTAERIGCSVGTVRNARNELADLSGVYLIKIQDKYGAHAIDPVTALGGARGIPIEATAEDLALPTTAAAVHRLAVVTAASSPGGSNITHAELLEILPVLDEAMRSLSALKVRADKILLGSAAA